MGSIMVHVVHQVHIMFVVQEPPICHAGTNCFYAMHIALWGSTNHCTLHACKKRHSDLACISTSCAPNSWKKSDSILLNMSAWRRSQYRITSYALILCNSSSFSVHTPFPGRASYLLTDMVQTIHAVVLFATRWQQLWLVQVITDPHAHMYDILPKQVL